MPPIPPQNSNSNSHSHSEEDAEISLTDEDESNSPVVHPQKQHLKQPHEKSSHPSGSTTTSSGNGLSFSSTVILVVVATVAYSMHGVLTELCKRSNDGKLPFNTSALVMLSEVIKLVVSFSLLYVSQVRDPSHSLPDGADSHDHIKPSQLDGMVALLRSLIFPIDWGMVAPALIYGINNPISFIALNYMDAATFQALSNLKIITTTLLSWIVFRKSFTPVHWTSITLLFLGCLLTTESSNAGGDANSETLGASFFGLILMIVSAVFSALAGVAFEFYAKKQKNESLHAQNFRLYLYGIVFNVIGMIAQFIYSGGSSSSSGQSQEWFIQFTFWTICVLLNQSFAGLLLSAIMRYADNIVRLYCIAAATILSTLFAVLVLGMTLHKLWIYAALLIGMSIYLYNVTLFHSSLNVSFTSSESENHEDNKVVFFNLTRSDLSKIVKSIAVVTAITFVVVYSNKF